jgi:hypothetical protein
MSNNESKKFLTEKFNQLLMLPKSDLIKIAKDAADTYLEISEESGITNSPFEFLLTSISTFINLDNKIDHDEFELYNDVFGGQTPLSFNDFSKKVKLFKGRKNNDTILFVRSLLERFDLEKKELLKKSLVTLGLVFCCLDGKLSIQEIDILSEYSK